MLKISSCLLLLLMQVAHAQPKCAADQSVEGFQWRVVDFRKSWQLQQEALARAKNAKDRRAMATAYALLSITCRRNQDTVQMRAYIDSATTVGDINTEDGFVTYARARYLDFTVGGKATADNYLNALHTFLQRKNYVFATLCAADISHLFEAPSDSTTAEKYAKLALQYAAIAHTPDCFLYAGRCHADYLLRQQKVNKTERGIVKTAAAYREVIASAELRPDQIFNKSELAFCYLNLAVLYQNNGRLFPETDFLTTLKKAQDLAFTYHFKSVFRNAYGLMGDYYIGKKDFAAAKENYLKGIGLAQKLVPADNSAMLAFYQSLKNMAAMQQNWKQFQIYDSAYEAQAELRFDEAIRQAVHAADIKYEATRKKQQIQALQQENDHQRKIQLLVLSIAVLVLAAAIFMVRGLYFKMNYSQQQEAVLRISKEIAEKDKVLLENRLLQSQMKPHFIFNTLSAIHGIVLQHKTTEAASMIIRFSKLMRAMLEHTQQEWIAFEEEVELLQRYITLQQMRFGYCFHFEVHTGDIGHHILIPPMLIQPFVENAIEHGFRNMPAHKTGQLLVRFERIDHALLRCTVTDDGCGRGAMAAPASNGHTSMATQLTQQRLAYYQAAHPGAGVHITDLFEGEQPAGTGVTVLLPYQTD